MAVFCFLAITETYTAKLCSHSMMFVMRRCFCVDFAASFSPTGKQVSRFNKGTRPDSVLSTKLGGIGGIAAPVGLLAFSGQSQLLQILFQSLSYF